MPDNLALSLPLFIHFFWAVTLLLRWKRNFRSQNIWILLLLTFCITSLVWITFFQGTDNWRIYYRLDVLDSIVTIFLPSFIFFYFRALTDERPFGWKEYRWLIPGILISTCTIVLYRMMSNAELAHYIEEMLKHKGKIPTNINPIGKIHFIISVWIFNAVIIIQILIALSYAIVRLIRYRKRLNNFFSNLEGKSLRNVYSVLIGFFLLLLVMLAYSRGRFYYKEHLQLLLVLNGIYAAIQYFVSYNVYHMAYTAEGFANELQQADKEAIEEGFEMAEINEPSGSVDKTEENSANWNHAIFIRKRTEQLAQFEQLIKEKKIFLQPDLRLDDVARMMHTNRTYISRMINEEFQCTFSDYINLQRIEYAQKLMHSYPDQAQELIAEQSGFTHVSSFSRAFTHCTGTTYREWKRKHNF